MSMEVSKENSKKIANTLGERAKTIEEFERTSTGLSPLKTSINKMAGKPEGPEDKSQLVKAGTTLILIPDPFPVTDVVGLAMITAGIVHKKYKKKPLTIYDAKREFAESMKQLEKLRQSSIL